MWMSKRRQSLPLATSHSGGSEDYDVRKRQCETPVTGEFVDAGGRNIRKEAGQRAMQRDADAGEERRTTARLATGAVPPLIRSLDGKPVTTLLVRNVSRRILQEDAMYYWPCSVYNYDLFYLQLDISKKRGCGRIFINFPTHEDAVAFRDQFHGRTCPYVSSTNQQGIMQPLDIQAANQQGFEPNLEHWQQTKRRDVDASLLPFVFVDGFRQDFWQYVANMDDDTTPLHIEYF